MNADHTQKLNETANRMPGGGLDAGLDGRFDAVARSHHAASLERLSPRAQARLTQAQRAAALPGFPHRAAWVVPAAFAAVALLAIAVQLRPEPASVPAGTPDVALATADAAADPTAPLDENPDFYLWLASTDDVMPSTPEY